MQHDSELRLIVPGICGPLAETRSLKSGPVIERWIKTLSKASSMPSANSTNEVLAEIFELEIKGDFPSAALTLLANKVYDAHRFYMHADPVHLQADMDHAILTSSADLDISNDEAAELCETLNQHFEQDGLEFFALNKDRWFVSSKNRISMSTTTLVDATGRNINFILPAGEDSSRWKQVMTEAQMLMHSHAVNQARENAGLATINSLWFHGSGELIDIKHTVDQICSNDDMLKGIASVIECDYRKLPDTVNEYAEYLLSCRPGANNVLHISKLEHLVNYTDVSLWLAQLSELLHDWIYPLLEISRKNNINLGLYACNGKRYQFSKYDFLKFWRNDELEKHVSSYR
jgi:hypothetical protein